MYWIFLFGNADRNEIRVMVFNWWSLKKTGLENKVWSCGFWFLKYKNEKLLTLAGNCKKQNAPVRKKTNPTSLFKKGIMSKLVT
jgi:hypothetical protein